MSVEVKGAARVRANLAKISDKIRARVRQAVERSAIEVQRKVKQEKLTGGVLNVRTGRLRRSITTKTTEDGAVITGTTGTNVSYGAAWERGFDKVANIRSYVRRIKGRDVRGKVDGKRQVVARGVATVRAHTRHMKQQARPFLRPSLDELSTKIRERLTRAVNQENPNGG